MKTFDIKTLIVGLILGFLLGIIGACICKCKFKDFNFIKIFDKFAEIIQKLWYIIILVLFTIYVYLKYPECTKFTFFSDFNGDDLVFILYLILLVLPLFDKLEMFGVNLGLRWQNKISDQVAQVASNTKNILNPEELKELSSKNKEANNE